MKHSVKTLKQRLEKLQTKGSKRAIKQLYHDIEETWFKVKRTNDVSTIRHKDTSSLNVLYDEVCELVVAKGVLD